MNKYLSACGLDCPDCECYKATLSGDLAQKQDIAERWSKNYQASLTVDDIHCEGCMSSGRKFSWCDKCPIRVCVVENGYQSCAECDSFPCQTNAFLYEHVPAAKENILSLR